MNIGARLKLERKRLGLSQTTIGMHGGVMKATQLNYENGNSYPDAAYLRKVAACGVDILYVVTGQRNPDIPGVMVLLSPKHQSLVTNFDAATEADKKIIEGVARLAAQQSTKTSSH